MKTAVLLMTLITATLYVYTTITPVLGFSVPYWAEAIYISHNSGYSDNLGLSLGDRPITLHSPTPGREANNRVWWINEDPSGSPPVTVTSQAGSPESFDYTIQPGKWVEHTFEHIGTYFDKNNPRHKGEIIVVGTGSAPIHLPK